MISAVALKGAAVTLLTYAGNLAARALGNQKNDSLASFTKATRVEPIALVDKSLVHQAYLPDAMQVLLNVFTGYYMQAVALTGTAVNGVSALKVLDTLNPTRDVKDAAATAIVTSLASYETPSLLSTEAYRYSLPVPGESIGLENFGRFNDPRNRIPTSMSDVQDANDAYKADRAKPGERGSTVGGDAIKSATEAVNLSVGRIFEVSLVQGDQPMKVPVSVRLISTVVDSTILAHILGGNGRNNSLKERYHAWRAGQLEFIRDIVFMQDLIDAHRENLNKDSSGVYAEIMQRRRNNNAAGWLSGTPSIGSASNIIVLSKRTADAVERAEGGRFNDARFRERIFKNTYIMLMMVIDEDMERVNIYHRGIALPTQLSVKELKVSSKGGGPDVMEMMKAFTLGNAVRL